MAAVVCLGAIEPPPTAAASSTDPLRLLIFSKTAGFRHESIPAGIEAITVLGREQGWVVTSTEDADEFAAGLAEADVIVFLNTTGDILDPTQQAEVESFIHGGGGFVGIHAATDTEYEWEWYGRLVGARFASHPQVQPASIEIVDQDHCSTSMLPQHWERTDEWYNFRELPRDVTILAKLDESSYQGGSMDGDHPIIWCHEFDGGRAWYTACGHTIESFSEPLFLRHLTGGIQWASGRDSLIGAKEKAGQEPPPLKGQPDSQ